MPSTNIGVVSIDSLFIFFGPKRLIGFPESGTLISIAKADPEEVKAIEGCDGEITVFKKKGKLYMADITFARSSASNGYLWNVLQTQRNSPTIPFLPFAISHEETKMAAARACIAAAPPVEFLTDAPGNVAWKLLLLNFDGLFRGISVDGPNATIL